MKGGKKCFDFDVGPFLNYSISLMLLHHINYSVDVAPLYTVSLHCTLKVLHTAIFRKISKSVTLIS